MPAAALAAVAGVWRRGRAGDHAPPRDNGDLDDLPHRGFACYGWLLRRLRPHLMLHGHVHLDYGLIPREHAHPSGTRIVNAFRCWEWNDGVG